MRPEVPHRELGEKLVRIRCSIGFLPKPLIERFAILVVKSFANIPGYSVLADIVGEFMHADVPTFVTIFFKFKKIFLPTGSEQTSKTSRPFIHGQSVILLEFFSFEMLMLGQVRRHLVAAND